MTVIGITREGEQLRFEQWVYDRWIHGILNDEWLARQLARCLRFVYA